MICRYCNGTGTSNTCVNGTFKPCAACNGTGEEREEREEKISNFDRITASPEALAKVIMGIVTSSEAYGYNGYCLFDDFDFDEFMKNMKDYDEKVGTKTGYEHYKEVLMWLKQERRVQND